MRLTIGCIKMVPLVSFLAALRILTEAQSCNNGIGRLVYEKVSDYRLSGTSGFGDKPSREVVSKTGLPIKVLEECIRRCQEDKTTSIESCYSFDFAPGKRRSSPFPKSQSTNSVAGASGIDAEYEESQCTLFSDRGAPDGGDLLVRQQNAWHFNEVCLSSNKLSTDCPNRLYVFERIPSYKFEGMNDKEMTATNRTECEDQCLSQSDLPCRSATFEKTTNKCRLSRETRYMNPRGFKSDPNSDYLENMCLKRNQMCTSTAFILETGKELDGAYERELIAARDFQECSNYCLNSLEERGFLCRSFIFDDGGRTCILYDEDPLFYGEIGQDPRQASGVKRPLKPSAGNLYRVLCVSAERDNVISNATLEHFRRKRLDGIHEVTVTAPSFYHCLEECARRYGQKCESVEYSSKHRVCRFSSSLTASGPITNRSAQPGGQYPPPIGLQPQGSQGNYPGYSNMYAGNPNQNLQSSPWNSWRDHHRGGFGLDRPQQGFTSGGYGGPPSFGSRHPGAYPSGYGSHGSLGPENHGGGAYPSGPPLHFGGSNPPPSLPLQGHPPPQLPQFPPLPPPPPLGPIPLPHPSNQLPGPTYGIPYHSQGFPVPHPNAIPAPYPPHFGPDRCLFPGAGGAPGAPGMSVRFQRVGFGSRLRSMYIFKVIRADRVEDCERTCVESRDFTCKSFNYRAFFPAENCELSQYDLKTLKLENPAHFEQQTQFDYYERDAFGGGPGGPGFPADCLEVAQTCTPDGMEFTLRTPEGFYGRIYTYGFYDSCFYDGNGGSVNVLRISRANGFPRCGTQQYGDAMTNIVVVQFNDFVQTSRDKKYNLTCYFSGPGEAVVTSNYLDAKTDGRYPTQIEHLPAQNILTSNVVLRVLYRGTPTNTIVVGDLLTFRLEARGHYRYDYYNSDIFATNVIAKDPYTGRQVHLIDSRGCPVDLYVFPELHKTPDGALEAEFYAFKIPDSTFLVFQATVRTCRGPCEPVICTDRGRGHGSFPSWGRKRRSISQTVEEDNLSAVTEDVDAEESLGGPNYATPAPDTLVVNSTDALDEEVHELLRVYLSRADVPSEESKPLVQEAAPTVCVAQSGYYALVTAVTILVSLIMAIGVAALFVFRKSKLSMKLFQLKEAQVSSTNPNIYVSQFLPPSSNHHKFDDPSEPIYTDPSLFERSRSLRSVTVSSLGQTKTTSFNDE